MSQENKTKQRNVNVISCVRLLVTKSQIGREKKMPFRNSHQIFQKIYSIFEICEKKMSRAINGLKLHFLQFFSSICISRAFSKLDLIAYIQF